MKNLIELPEDPNQFFQEICILDTEASGIDLERSYPIEIAWLSLDGESEDSFLINPKTASSWVGWGKWAEDIHHISLETCINNGISVNEAAERLNSQLSGCLVVSDALPYDLMWIKRLFDQTSLTMDFHMIDIRDFAVARGLGADEVTEFIKIKRNQDTCHRAQSDCHNIIAAAREAKIFPEKLNEA